MSIYIGEGARFLIVFSPADYVSELSDYSCDNASVELSMEEGADNVLRVDVLDTIAPDTEVNIFFKGQKFMHVACVVKKMISDANLDNQWGIVILNSNFDMPSILGNRTVIDLVAYYDDVPVSLSSNNGSGAPYIGFTNDAGELFPSTFGISHPSSDLSKWQLSNDTLVRIADGHSMVISISKITVNDEIIYQNP